MGHLQLAFFEKFCLTFFLGHLQLAFLKNFCLTFFLGHIFFVWHLFWDIFILFDIFFGTFDILFDIFFGTCQNINLNTPLCFWAPGHLGIWAYGHQGIWASGHLGFWYINLVPPCIGLWVILFSACVYRYRPFSIYINENLKANTSPPNQKKIPI